MDRTLPPEQNRERGGDIEHRSEIKTGHISCTALYDLYIQLVQSVRHVFCPVQYSNTIN